MEAAFGWYPESLSIVFQKSLDNEELNSCQYGATVVPHFNHIRSTILREYAKNLRGRSRFLRRFTKKPRRVAYLHEETKGTWIVM
jgi:hypothetical protein